MIAVEALHECIEMKRLRPTGGNRFGLGHAAFSLLALMLLHTCATADDRSATTPIRGVVRAAEQASLSTESPLLALEVPFRDGDRFRRGDVLITFDCRRQRSEYDAAVAVHREATLNLDSNLHLDRHGAVARNEVEIARARNDRTKADLAALKARLDDCRFVAPFDGRVVESGVRPFERTVPQRPFLSIINDTRLEIEVIAASELLAALRPGVPFAFTLDELGGRTMAAEILVIGSVVDPVSKTVRVIGVFKEPVGSVLAGMSGTAQFQAGP